MDAAIILYNLFIVDIQTKQTYPGQSFRSSVGKSVRHTFVFPFCQRPWDLTKGRDDIVVSEMVDEMVSDVEVDKVADMVADMVADKVAYMVADMVRIF